MGAATAKLREPKHVWTRGTANKLYSLMNEVDETERNVSMQSSPAVAEKEEIVRTALSRIGVQQADDAITMANPDVEIYTVRTFTVCC